MTSSGGIVSGAGEPVTLASSLDDGRFVGFGVAPSWRGLSVVRGVGSGSGVGFGFGAGVTLGVGFGVGLGVGPGVGVAWGWDGLGLSEGLANAVTPFPPPSGCSIANAGAPISAVTRMAAASEADLVRAPIGMVRIGQR
jgi:hypothetical protein